jgi:hypothetical protein
VRFLNMPPLPISGSRGGQPFGMSAAMPLQPLHLIFQQVLGQHLRQRRCAEGAKQRE